MRLLVWVCMSRSTNTHTHTQSLIFRRAHYFFSTARRWSAVPVLSRGRPHAAAGFTSSLLSSLMNAKARARAFDSPPSGGSPLRSGPPAVPAWHGRLWRLLAGAADDHACLARGGGPRRCAVSAFPRSAHSLPEGRGKQLVPIDILPVSLPVFTLGPLCLVQRKLWI